jgi:DNA-binding transcriptional MerR regulator
MHSSELARLAGVSTDTLRYYERLRLFPPVPRSAAGDRLFPAQALDRVRPIRGALAIGFSIRELTAIFAERDRGGAPCQRVLLSPAGSGLYPFQDNAATIYTIANAGATLIVGQERSRDKTALAGD